MTYVKRSQRGALYMIWGTDPKYGAALERSRAAFAALHPDLPTEVVMIDAADPYEGLRSKPRMLELSPFAETVFLDVDTVPLMPLDFGFEKAAQFGLACCINESPWARRYAGLAGDLIEYNTGVMFFTEKARHVFDAWQDMTPKIDASSRVVSNGKMLGVMPFADQCAFAAAIDHTGFQPFVLPLNWNFRPQWQRSFFGPIKIWHDYADPPQVYRDLARYYAGADAIVQYVELK